METNEKPRRCVNTDGARLYPGRRPEYLSVQQYSTPTGRKSKGRLYDSDSLPA